jgi:TPR repeat protein
MTFVKRIEGTMSSPKMITTLLLLLASLCVSAPAKAESADQRQVYACGRIHNQQSTNIKEDTLNCAEYLEPRLKDGRYLGFEDNRLREMTVKLALSNCEAGRIQTCNALSFRILNGFPGNVKTNEEDRKNGIRAAQISCKQDNIEGCSLLAEHWLYFVLYPSSDSQLQDPSASYTAAVFKDCKGGTVYSCRYGGKRLVTGEHGGSPNPAVGIEMLKHGCDILKDSESCRFRASFYFEGKGVEKNQRLGFELTNTFCDMATDEICSVIAAMMLDGPAEYRNLEKAAKIYNHYCDNDMDRCLKTANMQYEGLGGMAMNRIDAQKKYESICRFGFKAKDAKYAITCYRYGLAQREGADGLQKNKSYGAIEAHRGCYFANPSACPSLYKAVNVKGTTGNANEDRYQMGCVLAKSLETCMAIAREKAGKMTSGGPSALQENNELANQAIWHIVSNYPQMKQDKELRALGKKSKAPDYYFN